MGGFVAMGYHLRILITLQIWATWSLSEPLPEGVQWQVFVGTITTIPTMAQLDKSWFLPSLQVWGWPAVACLISRYCWVTRVQSHSQETIVLIVACCTLEGKLANLLLHVCTGTAPDPAELQCWQTGSNWWVMVHRQGPQSLQGVTVKLMVSDCLTMNK